MKHNFMMLLIGSFYSPKIKTNKFIVLPREVNFMSLGMLTPTGEKRTNIKIMATYKKEGNLLLNFFLFLNFLLKDNCFTEFCGFLSYINKNQSSVQFSSVAQSCPTLCDPMNRSTPGLPPSPTPRVYSNSFPSSH